MAWPATCTSDVGCIECQEGIRLEPSRPEFAPEKERGKDNYRLVTRLETVEAPTWHTDFFA